MAEKPSSTARLEAFSDGVIAVIITVMVLELKVPHENGPAGLYAIIPILLIYLLSFAFTGIYWINHQHLVERVESADTRILYAIWGSLLPIVAPVLHRIRYRKESCRFRSGAVCRLDDRHRLLLLSVPARNSSPATVFGEPWIPGELCKMFQHARDLWLANASVPPADN